MKSDFPVLFAKASTLVGAPIIAYATMDFILTTAKLPAAQVYPMAITAFGVTGVLAGICFTAEPLYNGTIAAKYAGEKFLHSSLLLLESTILIYVKDALISVPFITAHNPLKFITDYIFGVLVIFVSAAAGFTWYHGFCELNNALWKSWENRVIALNSDSEDKEKRRKELPPNNNLHTDEDKVPRP